MSDTNMSDTSGTTRVGADYRTYDDKLLAWALNDMGTKAVKHRRWALIAEVTRSAEPCPETQKDLGEMEEHHTMLADYYERCLDEASAEYDRREAALEEAAQAAEANDLHTKGLEAEAAGPTRGHWQGCVPELPPVAWPGGQAAEMTDDGVRF